MAAPTSAGICADAAAYLKIIARRQLNAHLIPSVLPNPRQTL